MPIKLLYKDVDILWEAIQIDTGRCEDQFIAYYRLMTCDLPPPPPPPPPRVARSEANMVEVHLNSDRGKPLPPHRLLFRIRSKGSFICTIPDKIAHTTAFVTPVVEHWQGFFYMHHHTDRTTDTTNFVTLVVEHRLEREIAISPPWRIDPTTQRTMSERSYHGPTNS